MADTERDAATDERIEGERHPIARMILIGVAAAIVGTAITLAIDWFPVGASTAAGKVDTLYDVLLIASVPIFVLVMTVAIYCVFKFRAKPGDTGDGAPIHGNAKLEVVWVTIPFLLVAGLAIYGWVVLDDIEAKQPNELVVGVTAQQFTWTFQYPRQEVESSELVLPRGRPVELRIQTKDVVHSFWVPEFRLKSDAVPGLTTRVRLTPDQIGRYTVVCAELCGIGHSTMRKGVRVVTPDEFDAFLAERRRAEGDGGAAGGDGERAAAEGERVFAAAGCGSCHTLEAAGATGTVGPSLDELSRRDPAYLRESILDPDAVVVEGFQEGIMPSDFGEQLSEDEVDALVQYLLEASGGNSQ